MSLAARRLPIPEVAARLESLATPVGGPRFPAGPLGQRATCTSATPALVRSISPEANQFARPQAELRQKKMDAKTPGVCGFEERELRHRVEDEDRLGVLDPAALADQASKRVVSVRGQMPLFGRIAVERAAG